MAELRFEIAKKLQKPQKGAAGLTLRSFQFSREAEPDANQVILLAENYGMIKEQARSHEGIRCRAMGKSLRVSSDDAAALADFAKDLPFNSEEALDVFEFLAPAFRSEAFTVDTAVLEPGSMSVKCVTQIAGLTAEDGSESDEPDPAAAESFYSALSAELDRYSMGIIK
jgi:hypothetical protein